MCLIEHEGFVEQPSASATLCIVCPIQLLSLAKSSSWGQSLLILAHESPTFSV